MKEIPLSSNQVRVVSRKTLLAEARKIRDNGQRPLLAHVVANGVIGDSRVIKSALTAKKLGINTVIIGCGPKPQFGEIQGVPVFIAPVTKSTSRTALILARASRADSNSANLHDWLNTRHKKALLQQDIQQRSWIKATRDGGSLVRTKLRTRQQDDKTKLREHNGTDTQWLAQSDVATRSAFSIAPVLEAIRPDAVHAHDIIPLEIAAQYSAARKLRKHPFGFVYDAHEHVSGLAEAASYRWKPLLELESNYIGLADQVITVSDTIANHLRTIHSLSERPGVVPNSPEFNQIESPSLRDLTGLDPDVPIMVHSGWIDNKRGVNTAVAALELLPDVHLVLVVGKLEQADDAIALAKKLGLSERVHIAGYVQPNQIANYLRGINIGLIPRDDHPNHRVSLPTKFREYLMADVPLVVSNVGELVEVQKLGVGEVFEAGNPADLADAVRKVLDHETQYLKNITDELKWEMSWDAHEDVLAATYAKILPGITVDQGSPVSSLDRSTSEPDHKTEAQLLRQEDQLKRFGTALTLGPFNSAGQASFWGRAVTSAFGIPATTMAFQSRYRYPTDITLNGHYGITGDLDQRIRQVRVNSSHLLIDSFAPIFGSLLNYDIHAEASFIESLGTKLAYVAHGSDIRSPSMHREYFEFSYFNETPESWTNTLEASTAKHLAIAKETDAPIYVSTPDLQLYIAKAKWLPLAIDFENWKTDTPVENVDRPIVLHLPSRSDPPIKGTVHVDRVMQDLHDRGVIEYRRPDQCTHSEMRKHIQKADIVVDQILTGSYGVTAVEAMAAGRVVIGNVGQSTRNVMEEEPPIIDASPANLAEVMEQILDQKEFLRETAQQGAVFAEKWHNGRKSALVLEDFLF